MESHNQVRTFQKKRTTNFREDETKLLIQLWGSPQIQNKLYLTHRKAPVMRLLAANMQHRGFYRTPDEIKTRIRNLKCLYHRIKRSMQTGAGIGTVDPDWPHFKAMDEILSKKHQQASNLYKDNILEGPRCEDIKQEIIDDIDINDDMESFTTNSMNGSDAEFEDEAHHMPPLAPASDPDEKKQSLIKIAPKHIVTVPQPKSTPSLVSPKVQLPLQSTARTNNTNPPNSAPLPFPLLILNGLPSQAQGAQSVGSNGAKKENGLTNTPDVCDLLKNLINIQKENLEVERQRLDIEKQTLEYHKTVGNQLLSFMPLVQSMVSSESGRSSKPDTTPTRVTRKRPASSENNSLDILKDSKILRTVLEEGIKKYMMADEEETRNSETDDSGVHNDDKSDSSEKPGK